MFELNDRHQSFDMPNNPLNLDRILVLIPVLNEEASIAGVIQMLQHQGWQHISIADNGSSDRSAEIATNLGAEVVSEPVRGYGQACWVVLIPF